MGDVILATGVLEKLHQFYPKASIDFLVRKGNEGLVANHPFINEVLVWNKREAKYKNLFGIIKQVRSTKYDAVFNLQRFAASGLVTLLSGSKYTAGFDKNPFSFSYNFKVKHQIDNGKHELERNQELIAPKTTKTKALPRLYPSDEQLKKADLLSENNRYVVLAPASVWFTKQLPTEKWIELLKQIPATLTVFLIGGPNDKAYAEKIAEQFPNRNIKNLCGELNLLESAALMKKAVMNYVNDSAPLHMAGSVQAPATAFFCSTVPRFGFGPFLPSGKIAEISEPLNCRPCGLHGHKACPEGHFNCAFKIDTKQVAVQ